MDSLGIALLWCAAEGVLLLGVAVVLYCCSLRHGPRAAAWVASAALVVLALLLPLNFLPVPSWWLPDLSSNISGRAPASASDATQSAPAGVPQSAGGEIAHGGFAVPVRSLWTALRSITSTEPRQARTWPRVCAGIFLVGAGVGLAYFVLGLLAVRALRRRSRPIHDQRLLAEFEALAAELGCRLPAELRESADIGSAATIGWRCPLVLLPEDWRAWSSEELHAVLAHELAHISRHDYAIWLLARLSVALHFYNPLAHWLAGRLQLQQELAADAEGASCVGGTKAYLQAVARLALRQDRWLRCWPARAFLTSGGTWKRRIAMLQSLKPMNEGRWSPLLGWCTAAALLAVAVGASALRGAAEPLQETSQNEAAPVAVPLVRLKLPPFDLSHVPLGARGVYGFRPAVFCSHPDIRPFLPLIDKQMGFLVDVFGFKGNIDLKVSDIEQMTGVVELKRQPDNTNSLEMGLTMLRMVHEYDWTKRIMAWIPDVTVRQHDGHRYYKVPEAMLIGLSLKMQLCAFVLDSRTIVLGDESFVKDVIENLGKPRTDPEWLRDWNSVDQCCLAVALDNNDFHLAHDINKDGKPPMPLTPICEKVTSLVVGLDGSTMGTLTVPNKDGSETRTDFGGNLIITALARCADEKSAAEVKQAIEAQFKRAREWAAIVPASTEAKDKSTSGQVLSELLNPLIEQHGTTTGFRAETRKSLIAIKDALIALEAQVEK